jgi:hypothetical protein
MIKEIEWSDPLPPDDDCRYDHIKATTSIGSFLVTWKGWKLYDWPTLDECPWDPYPSDSYPSVDEAKRAIQEQYNTRILQCLTNHKG